VLPDAQVERVLVVTAHPDDVDFGAAGTVARFCAQGIEVVYCVCTDGDAGGFDPAVDRADIPGIRRAEQEAAAKAVGVSDVRFLGYQDGRLVVSQELRRDISRVIRDVRPQRVLIQSPERNWARLPASHPTTWPPVRRRSARSIPTRATRSPIPSCCATRDSTRGRSPRRG
jgi:LmbE family N-acetylglucosaminyl deacetylase